ncbi:hypothetical protein FZEAL_2896 [Fusarium zealandicum]|uniref:Uncharacterized protein n=1 Tax=Fusarium zealandicum TaxID=1053134 RepID=A0A8H4UQ74_9HYPO|nr:hypothetical protein FZEAL_2896 [Fusarium zealandicum]
MGCFTSKEAKISAATIGVDPVLGSDHRAVRFENQLQGQEPRYYNPLTSSVHVRQASATWESYPGEIAGIPRPVPKAVERAPRPARFRPVPQRASLANVKWSSSVKMGNKAAKKRGPLTSVTSESK